MNESKFRKIVGIENMLNEMFCRTENETAPTSISPKVNAITSPNGVVVTLYYPGAKKTDFSLKTEEGNIISIEGSFENAKLEESEQYAMQEHVLSSFERKFVMPKHVNKKKIKASYLNGVLEVVIPIDKKAEKNDVFDIVID